MTRGYWRVFLFLGILVLSLLVGCKPKEILVQGTYPGGTGLKLYLESAIPACPGVVDSAVVAGDGSFTFHREDLRGLHILRVPRVGQWFVYLSEVPTRLVFTEGDPVQMSPYGDTLNYPVRQNHAYVSELGRQLHAMNAEFKAREVDGRYISVEQEASLDAAWAHYDSIFCGRIHALIEANLRNPVGLYFLYQYASYFTPEELEALQAELSAAPARLKHDEAYPLVEEVFASNRYMPLGAKAPELTLRAVDSGYLVLKALFGRKPYVLVTLWAYDDPVSMQANDSLADLVSRYGDRLDVYSVEVAASENPPCLQAAVDTITQHHYPWPTGVWGLTPGVSKLPYTLYSTPANMLYDLHGLLTARNISLRALSDSLAKAAPGRVTHDVRNPITKRNSSNDE